MCILVLSIFNGNVCWECIPATYDGECYNATLIVIWELYGHFLYEITKLFVVLGIGI